MASQTVDNGLEPLKAYVEEVDRHVAQHVGAMASGDTILDQSMRTAMVTGGKRFRPVLSLLACEAVSGDYTKALPVAVAYELSHNASLVQDDILDSSEKRRGRPTIFMERGVTVAILTSDILLFEVFSKLAEYEDLDLEPNRVYKLLRLVANSARDTVLGEYSDLTMSVAAATVDDYLRVIDLKTGSLMAAATAAGAIVGGATEEQTAALYKYGQNLGLAYQVRDDILDIAEETDGSERPVLTDLRNGGFNIVFIHALRHAPPNRRGDLYGMIGKRWFNRQEIKKAVAIFNDLGSIMFAENLASSLALKARGQLTKVRSNHAANILEQLTYLNLNKVSAGAQDAPIRNRPRSVRRDSEDRVRILSPLRRRKLL